MARRALIVLAAITALSPVASAYYFWIFFPGNAGPYAPVPARFDLNALKDNTVPFFISDQPPGPLVAGDSTTAVYSQIQLAAGVWNSVSTSSLRLRFGGVAKIGVPQNTPGIDVVFDDDIPPGIIAQTKPTFPADLSFLSAKGTTFVPILRTRVQLRRDLTAAGFVQPSYSDAFFTTLVHEFGHALGLQHTLTSGVMSTAITRATTKSAPLAADDIAGVSLLYPAPGFAAARGSITGRVTLPTAGVNMASIVALSVKGVAISSLSNPDGTYRIDGVPPGQYYVYAHPLPPALLGEGRPANIVPPVDPQGDDFSATTGFGTLFFPGTRDWTQAALVTVAAAKSTDGVDFAMTAHAGSAVSAMETYSYQNSVPIAAGPLPANSRSSVVFYANGTTANNQSAIAPGLSVSVIGGGGQIEPGSLKYYTQGFLQMIVDTTAVADPLPIALAVSLNNDLYVLPSAFTVVPNAPPLVTGMATLSVLGLKLNAVTGTGLSPRARVLFDGAPVTVLSYNDDGSLSVAPPPAPSGYTAAVEVLNPDGQSSLQALGGAAPAVFAFPLHDPSAIALAPDTLIAGTDVLIAVSGVNTHFADGQTAVGFGSSDISVRRAWVLSPQFMLLNVSVDPAISIGTSSLTVSTGLESVTLPDIVKIAAADPKQASLRVPVINALTGLAGVPAGGTALIRTSGLPADLTGWSLTIRGEAAPFTIDKNGVIAAQVPSDLVPGPQIVQLSGPAGTLPVARVLMQLDAAPPVIVSAVDGAAANGTGGTPVTTATPALLGDVVTLTVSGLSAPAGVLPPASAMWISVNGVNYGASTVTAVPQDPTAPPQDLARVPFVVPAGLVLDPAVQTHTAIVMVGTGTRLSAPLALPVAAPPTAGQ